MFLTSNNRQHFNYKTIHCNWPFILEFSFCFVLFCFLYFLNLTKMDKFSVWWVPFLFRQTGLLTCAWKLDLFIFLSLFLFFILFYFEIKYEPFDPLIGMAPILFHPSHSPFLQIFPLNWQCFHVRILCHHLLRCAVKNFCVKKKRRFFF